MNAPARVQTCWGMVSPRMGAYHDTEWGRPCHDDRALFELLILEGAQAGLSWETVLNRREGYRQAFAGFDAAAIARLGPEDVERLMADPGIIRNRAKIEATIKNARAFLAVVEEFGTFDAYIWSFAGGAPLDRPAPAASTDLPASTPEAKAMSRDLKKRGFGFVGETICYAFMQATGMVNDHLAGCPVRQPTLGRE
jgi:DNA-3-methyladenine glycosylase I